MQKKGIRSIDSIDKPLDPQKKDLLQKFPSLFEGVGTLQDHEVEFHIDPAIPPVCQRARLIPFHLRNKLDEELANMEEQDIIEEHHGPSPWVSNIVLAPKDNGAIRITLDMREPNKAIKPIKMPIPRLEEVRAELSDYKLFSKLDFRTAYHQLKLSRESQNMTVFHAGDRLMRYKRLTMGSVPASGELAIAL